MKSRTRKEYLALLGGLAAFGLLVTSCSTGASNADDDNGSEHVLQFATHIGPQTPDGAALEDAFEEIYQRTDGRIRLEPFWEGSLIGGDGMLSGLSSGQADLGHLTPMYFPKELPLSQIMSIPYIAAGPIETSDVLDDLYESNEAFKAEYEAHGIQVLKFAVPREVALAATSPIENVEALSGRSIRGTSYAGQAFEMAGANVIALNAAEVYESLDRGLIDGAGSLAFDVLPAFGVPEVAPYIADTGFGPYLAQSVVANSASWDGISSADQNIILEVLEELPEMIADEADVIQKETCDLALENGGEVIVWADNEQEKFQDLIGDTFRDDWAAGAGDAASEFFDTFTDGIEAAKLNSDEARLSGMELCAQRTE